MKLLFILGCLLASVAGLAQESRSTTKNISDDGNTLKLKYELKSADKFVNYSNQFNVKGWSKEQKDQLVTRVIDSLENNAGAAQREYVSTHIDDDGKTMKVAIKGRKNGNVISYNKSYDVQGMDRKQKDAIIEDLLKGLGLSSKQ